MSDDQQPPEDSESSEAASDGLETPRQRAARRREQARIRRRLRGSQGVIVDFPGQGAKTPPLTQPGSKDPSDTRPTGRGAGPFRHVTAGKRWQEIFRRIESRELTWDEVADSMDDEELARYQFKSTDGTFRGRPPKWTPRDFIYACDRALASRGQMTWKTAYVNAVGEVTRIALNSEKDSDRLKALTMIIERIEGRVPDRLVVQASGGQSMEEMLAGVMAEVNAAAAEEQAIARAHDYATRSAATDPEEDRYGSDE